MHGAWAECGREGVWVVESLGDRAWCVAWWEVWASVWVGARVVGWGGGWVWHLTSWKALQ